MGLFSGIGNLLGGKPSSSRPVEIPGIIGREEGAGYLRQATGMTGQPLPGQGLFDQTFAQGQNSPFQGSLMEMLRNPGANPYSSSLQSSIMNPNFGPINDAQRSLVDRAYSGRQAQFNNLGIGDSPAAQSAVAAAAAPTLQRFYQDQVQNMFQGQQSHDTMQRGRISDLLAGNQQYGQQWNDRMNAVMGQLDQQLKARGLDLNTLLNAAEMGKPQVAQQSTGARRGLFDFVGADIGPIHVGAGG